MVNYTSSNALKAIVPESDAEAIEVSVVLPCLNEAKTIEICIQKALKSLHDGGVIGEVVIADNGSTDGSQDLARKSGARVIDVEQKGYGSALRGGIAAAHGRFLMMADSDDSYELSNLMPFVEQLREGYDLVMGNRFRGGIEPGAMPPLHRYLGNPVLSAVGKLFFKTPARDFHCGLRGFTKDAVKRMDLRSTGMEFASEMVVKANLHEMKVTEVPTKLFPDGRDRAPHLRSWRDGWRHLRFLLMFCPRWLFFYPGLFFMIVGMTAGALLLPGARTVGSVTFDIHSLVYAATAVMIGFNAVLFALMTRVYALRTGFIPKEPRYMRALKVWNLETGLILGVIIFLLGFGGALMSVGIWNSESLGPLDPVVIMRIIIPSTLGLGLGSQLIFSSFFLSILNMETQDAPMDTSVDGQ